MDRLLTSKWVAIECWAPVELVFMSLALVVPSAPWLSYVPNTSDNLPVY